VYPDVDGLNQALKYSSSSYFRCPSDASSTAIEKKLSILQTDPVFIERDNACSGAYRRHRTAVVKSGVVRSALNGIQFSEKVMRLVNFFASQGSSGHFEDVISEILMSQIKVIGSAKGTYTFKSGETGRISAQPIAAFSSGVISAWVMEESLAIGDEVGWALPPLSKFSNPGWWSNEDMQKGKIMPYLKRIDTDTESSAVRRLVAAFAENPNHIMDIVAQVDRDHSLALIPSIALPNTYHELFKVAGLAWVYHLIAAGMLQPTPAAATATNRFTSSFSSPTAPSNSHDWEREKNNFGLLSLNFADAFRHVRRGAAGGASTFPIPGTTETAQVQTFGTAAAGSTASHRLAAASDWVIQMAQLLQLTISAPSPTGGGGEALPSEGFFRNNKAGAGPLIRNAQERAAEMASDVTRMILSASTKDSTSHRSSFTYDHTTGSRSRILISSGGHEKLNTSRDAGHVEAMFRKGFTDHANALGEYISFRKARVSGVVIEPAPRGGKASVYLRGK
jgi:hypothetical protein